MTFMPLGSVGMPETSKYGDVRHGGKSHSISYENDGSGQRVLTARMDDFGPEGALLASIELLTNRRTAWSSARRSTSPVTSTIIRR